MFWTFKLSFDVHILAFFGLATAFTTFPQKWANFYQPSLHPDQRKKHLKWVLFSFQNFMSLA
jgi:hypothetical protein